MCSIKHEKLGLVHLYYWFVIQLSKLEEIGCLIAFQASKNISC